MAETIRHPAKYSDEFIPIFAQLLRNSRRVLDPFAGVGKIGLIKQHGYTGTIYANDIEPEWVMLGRGMCDVISSVDAEFITRLYPEKYFDAICTSPTYGNRMADHHNAQDGSKRNTYTHCIGRKLTDGNTGAMQWGAEYREKHQKIYDSVSTLVDDGGIFILNVSNHIRNGKEVPVSEWHRACLEERGFYLKQDIHVATKRNRFGANADKRVPFEHIYVFEKRGNQ